MDEWVDGWVDSFTPPSRPVDKAACILGGWILGLSH